MLTTSLTQEDGISSNELEKISNEFTEGDNNSDDGEEHKRLGGYPPLRTLVRLSPGPLISQIVNSLYGVIDSMWVSKFIGEIGLTALSLAYILDNSALSFGFFIAIAASSQISYLFSKKQYEVVSHLSVDLLKVCVIFALIVPAVLFPCARPLFKFIGGTGKVNDLAFDYAIRLLSLNLVTCCYHCVCGILQAEGRTWLYGGAQIISMLLNMALFDPLLLWSMKRTLGSSLATEISMFIPASIILIVMFCGKFSTKPSRKYVFKCFCPETGAALKAGLSAFIMNISISLPSLILQKFIAIRANRVGEYDMIVAAYNAISRIYTVSTCVPIAINAAYLPAASYAFGKKDYKRLLWLTFHAEWMAMLWGFSCMVIIVTLPKQICSIWSKDERFLYWCNEIVPPSFYIQFLTPTKFIIVSLLQASQQTVLATITSFVLELGLLPIAACIFHYTGDPKSPRRIFYAYPVTDALSTVCSLLVALKTFINFYRQAKKQDEGTCNKSDDSGQQELKVFMV